MIGTVTLWDEVLPAISNRAYRTMDADPESLLEHDSGGPAIKADVIMARLLGMDDEFVEDYRISRVVPVIFRPIIHRPSLFMESTAPVSISSPKAEFRVQNGYALVHLAAEYAPPGVEVGPPTFDFRVLFLRYRRRL